MQTILGANGVIANNLVKALPAYTNQIRLVSRKPKKVNSTDEILSADLLNTEQTAKAVAGSKVAYLTAGLPYTTKVWREQWPVVMNNVIEACEKHNTKLVFFSNVYPYGKVSGKMTEETPFNPCSNKGEVRARIEETLLGEVKKGSIQAIIVRGLQKFCRWKERTVDVKRCYPSFFHLHTGRGQGYCPAGQHGFSIQSNLARANGQKCIDRKTIHRTGCKRIRCSSQLYDLEKMDGANGWSFRQ